MGRGRGGYTEVQKFYRDSGGFKVHDPSAIFVAERYIDQGYEAVFRHTISRDKMYDLTIKSSDDKEYIKNIEAQGVTSMNSSKISAGIKEGFRQLGNADSATVAIYLYNFKNDAAGRAFAQEGYEEAVRHGYVKGAVEVWFSDKTKINMN